MWSKSTRSSKSEGPDRFFYSRVDVVESCHVATYKDGGSEGIAINKWTLTKTETVMRMTKRRSGRMWLLHTRRVTNIQTQHMYATTDIHTLTQTYF